MTAMIETDADRLALLRDIGEPFDADGDLFFAVFDRERIEILVGDKVVEGRDTYIACRSRDIEDNSIIRDSKVRRVTDGATYFVKNIEPDGTGMSIVYLKQ